MLPLPSSLAYPVFFGAIGMIALGLGAREADLITLAGALLTLLAFALALTIPTARRVRREKLEFAWWLAHDDGGSSTGAVTPGAPFTIRCYVRNRGLTPIALRKMLPLVSDATRVDIDTHTQLVVPPRTRAEFEFRFVPPAVGRAVLHGLSVNVAGPLQLFEMPLYFPTHLVIKVLPAVAASNRTWMAQRTGVALERRGPTPHRRRGSGTELRELRELRPGDPYKSIAWRPSARRGELLVREMESEIQETHVFIVDVSGTMRGGDPGKRKLDFAIDFAASQAQHALSQGDRVGVTCIDARILSKVPAAEGNQHILRVYDALLACTEVVDADLTDVDEHELAQTIARYVRHQDGVEFTRADGSLDVTHMAMHLARSFDAPARRTAIVAESPELETLRRFCRTHGIRLPYRADPREGGKEEAMVSALHDAGGQTRGPRSIHVVTDFDGIYDFDALLKSTRFLMSRGHRVQFIVPDSVRFANTAQNNLEHALHAVYGRAEARRHEEARTLFRRIGAEVDVVGPVAPVSARATQNRRRAA